MLIGTLFIHCLWECKMVLPPWKAIWWFLTKLKKRITIWPQQFHFEIYTFKGVKTGVQNKSCAGIFIAALLIIAKRWGGRNPNANHLMDG